MNGLLRMTRFTQTPHLRSMASKSKKKARKQSIATQRAAERTQAANEAANTQAETDWKHSADRTESLQATERIALGFAAVSVSIIGIGWWLTKPPDEAFPEGSAKPL